MFWPKKLNKLSKTSNEIYCNYVTGDYIASKASIQYQLYQELGSLKDQTVEAFLEHILRASELNYKQAKIFYRKARQLELGKL